MSLPNFRVSDADRRLILAIAERAVALDLQGRDLDGVPRTKIAVVMDLAVAHNACPLKLAELLAADDANLAHDIGGIGRHLNRKTGELGGLFQPRYAA
jgi:uncharacterized protein DUF6874